MVEFGQRLRRLRKEKNMTQKQLAERVGLKNSVISFYETGERLPSPEVIKKLAATLQVSSDYLLGMEHGEMLDLHGLEEEDRQLVRVLVHTLRRKNRR